MRRSPLPWFLAAVFAASYATLACLRYAGYIWSSWDLAIFSQGVDGYAHLRGPVTDVKAVGYNLLGDHFSPVLALLAPFYRVFPSPPTLLIAQALLFGLSVVPITALAIRRLGRPAGVAVGLSYGLSYGLATATVVDFHEIAFAVPLLAFALVALVEERWRAAVGWALPLVLVKEDLGVTVAAIGVVVAWRGPRRTGLLLAGAGLFATALEVLVLIPHVAGAGYGYYGRFDEGAGDGLGGWAGIRLRLHTVGLILLSSAGAVLLTPIGLVAVPTLLWRFAANYPFYWGTDWHYDAVLMPVLFVGLVDVATRWRGRARWRHRYARLAVPFAAVAALALLVRSSPLRQLAEADTWTGMPQRAAMAQALALIPPGATVQSDLGLLSHLATRDRTTWIGAPWPAGTPGPQYVVVSSNTGWDPPAPGELAGWAGSQHPGSRYRLVWTSEGVTIVQRTSAG